MHLIIGIHCTGSEEASIAKILKRSLYRDPNTYFLYMPFLDIPNPLNPNKLKQKLPEKNIITIRFNSALPSQHIHYDTYSTDFSRRLQELKSVLGAKERVESTAIGGAANHCFKNINHAVHLEVQKVFGKQAHTFKSYVPLVYGSSMMERTQKMRIRTETLRKRKRVERRERKARHALYTKRK